MTHSGFPSPAQDYVEMGLNWNEHLIQHPASTFTVRMTSKSMEPKIPEGCFVIVDRSLEPKNQDVIVATYKDEFIIRRLNRNSNGVFLVPENPNFETLQVQMGNEFEVWGVVTFSIQQHRSL